MNEIERKRKREREREREREKEKKRKHIFPTLALSFFSSKPCPSLNRRLNG